MRLIPIILACVLFVETGFAQAEPASYGSMVNQSPSKKDLFGSDEILKITLTGNIQGLMNARSNDAKSYPLVLSCATDGIGHDSISIQAKTRGHFRRSLGDCTYPPLLLEFTKDDIPVSSIFSGQKKLKLVMPCQGADYVIREWMVYKIYNLVTSQSFRARLVSVGLHDTKRKKVTAPFYGILLEEDWQMATRNQAVLIKRLLRPEQTDSIAFLKMAVFQYLIGNTDWSVQYQNIKLMAMDSLTFPVPVPYDFDHAGLVAAPYARPAEALEMNSVRQRRYRGYCIADVGTFKEVIAFYNQLRESIYKLYTDCALLDAKYVKETLRYFDEFYATVNDPASLKKEFSYPCNKNGTGNVVIKGLKGDNEQSQR